jgi:hypothetical protein
MPVSVRPPAAGDASIRPTVLCGHLEPDREIRSLDLFELSQTLRGYFLDDGRSDPTVDQAIDRSFRVLQKREGFELRKVDRAIPVRSHVDRATAD